MTPTYYHPATQTYFTRGDAFTLEGVNHPAEKWADSEAITAMGLVPVVDVGTPADPRYFVNTEELVGAERRVVSTPKDPAVIEADAKADLRTALAELDAANALSQRNLRETVMLMAEAFKQISGGAVDLSAIPGVAQVYAVEAEAEALRAQL
jgi:hypothetical protein